MLPNDVVVNLSASIGIVLYPEHGHHAKMIANADAAMYAAKRAGGSTYAFFEPRMELDAREQLALQNDLRHAIERHELQLYYQPKIHAKSGQITGVEALLRWQHPVRGFVSPGLFIPIAERFGLIGAIGNWVIDEACRQMSDWRRQGLRMRVAVNLSVHQLRQEDLVQRVRIAVDALRRRPRAAHLRDHRVGGHGGHAGDDARVLAAGQRGREPGRSTTSAPAIPACPTCASCRRARAQDRPELRAGPGHQPGRAGRNRQLASSLNDANRRLRDQAHSDPLTRMPNRLMFEERMAAALAADRLRRPSRARWP